MRLNERAQAIQGEEVVRLGSELYERRIRGLVEPGNAGQFVAIHVDSGDFSVAISSSAAIRSLRANHPPDGRIFLRRIGDEPDYALSMRILAGENVPHKPARRK